MNSKVIPQYIQRRQCRVLCVCTYRNVAFLTIDNGTQSHFQITTHVTDIRAMKQTELLRRVNKRGVGQQPSFPEGGIAQVVRSVRCEFSLTHEHLRVKSRVSTTVCSRKCLLFNGLLWFLDGLFDFCDIFLFTS
jgi:hypothetical protein